MELDVAASTVEVTDYGIVIRWSSGSRSRFHALWLRANCPGDGGVTSPHSERLAELNPLIFVLDAEVDDDGDLAVEFSDGHESVFTFEWLLEHSHEPYDRSERVPSFSPVRAGSPVAEILLPATGSASHVELLAAVDECGVAIVSGADSGTSGVAQLGVLFGAGEGGARPLVGIAQGEDEALTDGRTLETYRTSPAGVVMMQYGDDPTERDLWMIDGFAVASDLRDRDPDAFECLARTSIPWVGPRGLRTLAPVIGLDRDYAFSTIRFDERCMAPFDIEVSQVGPYYEALIEFARLLQDPSRVVHYTLAEGQVAVIDNYRMLHSGGSGHVSIDRDLFAAQLNRPNPGVERHSPS